VEKGRAGSDIRLRLDSSDNAWTKGQGMDKEQRFEILEGVEYAAGTDAHKAAKERTDSAFKKLQKDLETLKAERDQALARADAADQKHGDLTKKVQEFVTPERLDRAVRHRVEVISKAKSVLGEEFKTDGLSNTEIKSEAIKKAYPDLGTEGKSKDYIDGLFRSISAAPVPVKKEQKSDAADRLRAAVTPVPGSAAIPKTVEQIRHDAVFESEQRAFKPLAMSRRDRYKEMSSTPMLQGAQLEVMK
jgi:hypothetical protein